jgi:chromosome segregation ATPase
MKTHLLAAAGSLVLLGGCTTTPEACDPYNRDTSLVAKLSCDVGGGYRSRIDAGERQVQIDKEENALFREIERQISEQQRATRNELRVTNQQHYELERNVQELVTRLQRRSQEQLGLQHQLNDLESQMAAAPDPSASEAEALAEREAYLEALHQHVNDLQQFLVDIP